MPASRPLAWYLLSLRAVGDHDGLRRAAARHGGGLVALSPWRLQPRDDEAARQALGRALRAPAVVFTSPAAVRAAAALQALAPRPGQSWLAVGAGTAAALRRAGVAGVEAPARMDSEGLLALPALRDIGGRSIGLVTAPGGRNRLAPALQSRGAEVRRADVYDRTPVAIADARWHALASALATPQRVVLALSSAEALEAVLRQRPVNFEESLRRVAVTAASERLAQAAREAGFMRITIAADARPASLLRAAANAFV